MRYVKAFGAAVLAVLISGGIMFNLPGASESTAAVVGAVAAVVGWSVVMNHGKA
jgi:hypothetical protein